MDYLKAAKHKPSSSSVFYRCFCCCYFASIPFFRIIASSSFSVGARLTTILAPLSLHVRPPNQKYYCTPFISAKLVLPHGIPVYKTATPERHRYILCLVSTFFHFCMLQSLFQSALVYFLQSSCILTDDDDDDYSNSTGQSWSSSRSSGGRSKTK